MQVRKQFLKPVDPSGSRLENRIPDVTQVQFTDGFWRNYQKLIVCSVLPHILEQIEPENYQNIVNAGRKNQGIPYNPHNGRQHFADSFVYETAESMAWALMLEPMEDEELRQGQQLLRRKLLEWIPHLVASQEPTGYIGSLWVLDANPPERPKLYDLAYSHEMYNMAMFLDAAIAVYRAIQDTRMLLAACRIVDLLDRLIGDGPQQKQMQPGHPRIEVSLMDLAELCDTLDAPFRKYSDTCRALSQWFLLNRGTDRNWHGNQQTNWNIAAKPLLEMTEADLQGQHTDRANYLFQAAANWGKLTGDRRYDPVLLRLYNELITSRIYITGGSGFTGAGGYDTLEAWPAANVLPNDLEKCCETCSAMTLIFWSHSMHQLFADSNYFDVIEQALYNTTLSQLNLKGNAFFYHQLLQSNRGELRKRWLGVPCCPVNFTRLVLNLSRYVFSHTEDSIWVNLYTAAQGQIGLSSGQVVLQVNSQMPWSGGVTLTVTPEQPTDFTLKLRIPGWCTEAVTLTVNGKKMQALEAERGYVCLRRVWLPGDQVSLQLPMDPVRVYTPQVQTNKGLVAIQRGPVVYCAEAADNPALALDQVTLSGEEEIRVSELQPLPGSVGLYGPGKFGTGELVLLSTQVQQLCRGKAVQKPLTLIPYYAWANRAMGQMRIFIREE